MRVLCTSCDCEFDEDELIYDDEDSANSLYPECPICASNEDFMPLDDSTQNLVED